MPQVDFYILDADSPAARHQFVARLLGKLQKLGKRTRIAVNSAAEAEQLDTLLWHYPPESFLPHCVEDAATPEEPIVISHRPESPVSEEVFINLRGHPPATHQQLNRVVEVVIQETAVLDATRRNFRFYREQGYPIQSHPIRSTP